MFSRIGSKVFRASSPSCLSPSPPCLSLSALLRHYHTGLPSRGDSGRSKDQFFADLAEGCPWLTFPKRDKAVAVNADYMAGFTYIPNYLPQQDHDFFYAAALKYASSQGGNRGGHAVKHDGRQVLTGLQSDFYKKFFQKLKSDGILKKPEQFPPNLYRNGDGIMHHFDNILHIGETVVSISLGVPEVVKFVHIPTGKSSEGLVDFLLDIMSKDIRYNCTHGIDPGEEKVFEGKHIKRTGPPRVSLIAAEMFQPNIIDAPGAKPGVPGITMQQFKDFCIIGTCGVWQHLDKERGYTNMQQKVEIMRKLAKAHFPTLLPHFTERLDYLAAHAAQHSL